jgi:hypothetical protein
MIIANRLTDGLVVFYVAESSWTTDIAAGLVIDADADAAATLRAAQADEGKCLIVDPQLIDVESTDGQLRPTAIREAIRAFGPTV